MTNGPQRRHLTEHQFPAASSYSVLHAGVKLFAQPTFAGALLLLLVRCIATLELL